METHDYSKHRKARKGTSKKGRTALQSLKKFFRATEIEKDPSKIKAVSFKAVLIKTRGFTFDREEANS